MMRRMTMTVPAPMYMPLGYPESTSGNHGRP